jgi:hypothetical protein
MSESIQAAIQIRDAIKLQLQVLQKLRGVLEEIMVGMIFIAEDIERIIRTLPQGR